MQMIKKKLHIHYSQNLKKLIMNPFWGLFAQKKPKKEFGQYNLI